MAIADLCDSRGKFSILAIDHRDSLRAFLRAADPDSLSAPEITALKAELIDGVADMASGVMLEPEYSIPQLVDALPSGVGFLAALESQGYLSDPEASPTTILDGWSVEQAKASGAASAKLLLPYRPDRVEHARLQEAVARDITAACQAIDFPIALEPLFYDLAPDDDRVALVVETAERFAAIGPDLLKLPYPGSESGCDAVTAAAQSGGPNGPMPWAMLSGGGSFEHFAETFAIAATAGCSGFMVGRALWGEWARATPAERPQIMTETVCPRFEELVAITVNT